MAGPGWDVPATPQGCGSWPLTLLHGPLAGLGPSYQVKALLVFKTSKLFFGGGRQYAELNVIYIVLATLMDTHMVSLF